MPLLEVGDRGKVASHFYLQIILYHGFPGSGRQYRAQTTSGMWSQFRPFHSIDVYTSAEPPAWADVGCNADRTGGPNVPFAPDAIIPMTAARSSTLGYTYFRIPDGVTELATQHRINNKVDPAEHWEGSEGKTFDNVYAKRFIIMTPPDIWLGGETSYNNYYEFLNDQINANFYYPEGGLAFGINPYPGERYLWIDISDVWQDADIAGRPAAGHIRCNIKKLWSARNYAIYTQRINFWNNHILTYRNFARDKGKISALGWESEFEVFIGCTGELNGVNVLPDSIAGVDTTFSCTEFGIF